MAMSWSRQQDIKKILAKDNITLSLIEVKDTRGLGVVEMVGDRIEGNLREGEKPPSNLVNAGIYLLTPEIFPAMARTKKSPRGEYELTDSLQLLLDQGSPISGVRIDYWLDRELSLGLAHSKRIADGGNRRTELGIDRRERSDKGAGFHRKGHYSAGKLIYSVQ